MHFSTAITRQPGSNFADGITTQNMGAPDFKRMLIQHHAYVETLQSLGLDVLVLPALPHHPDAYFVEDVAVITPEMAIITIPGAPARQGEEKEIAAAVSRWRVTACIVSPGTVDGGDVLQVNRHFYIGISQRTNQTGAEQLGSLLAQHGYTWTPVPVAAGLHLKSSVNYLGENTLLLTRAFAGLPLFKDFRKIILDSDEEPACNTILVNDHLLTPKGYPNVREKISALGKAIIELEISETIKMDGGLTCLSLRFT